jgi:mono/diheme cytochrome c family protein
MKHLSLFAVIILFSLAFSCGDKSQKQSPANSDKTEIVSESNSQEPAQTGKRESIQDSRDLKGVGKFTSVELAAIDPAKAKEGEEIFTNICAACHKMDARFVGPSMAGLTKRRSPEWILNMITNPELMIKEDPIGIALLKEYLAPMTNQNISDEDAYKLLDYFRDYDSK